MRARRRTCGGRTRSAFCSGMETSGWINPGRCSLQMRNGSTEAYTSPTSSIMTASGKCGTSRDRINNYLIHGYAESEDGRTGWSKHAIFAPAEIKMFDFCVRERAGGFDAIFARVRVAGGAPPPETGLWWCRARRPATTLADWGTPIQIMTAEDCGWHAGPWKPSFQFDERQPDRALVFFDGSYRTDDAGPFPFAFTLGCLEMDLPAGS